VPRLLPRLIIFLHCNLIIAAFKQLDYLCLLCRLRLRLLLYFLLRPRLLRLLCLLWQLRLRLWLRLLLCFLLRLRLLLWLLLLWLCLLRL
jgi:hypothetical protein